MRHMPQRWVPLARVLDRRILGGIAVVVTMSVVFVGALVVGWLLDSVGRNSGFAAFDESAAQWGAENATEGSTKILRAITLLGTSPVIALLAALVGAAVARRRRFGPLGYLTVVCGGVFLLNNALKLLVHRSRPDIGRRTTAAGWSFPSGHSATDIVRRRRPAGQLSRSSCSVVRLVGGGKRERSLRWSLPWRWRVRECCSAYPG